MGAQQSQRDYSYIKDGVKPKVKEEREEVQIWTRSYRKSLKKEEDFVRRCHVEVADFDFRQVVECDRAEANISLWKVAEHRQSGHCPVNKKEK